MVYAYYELGRRIYEEEQQGKERADYGKSLLKELSHYLKLMRISDVNERHFYEIEAAKNERSLSELNQNEMFSKEKAGGKI